jgi:uncharacterized protein YbaA (DUF1428 family)
MAFYVDGFVLPVPKKNVKKYKKLATLAAKVWIEHGALEYHECQADDVKAGKLTSFPQSVKLKAGEVVFFSWITYKSRSHRDKVLKNVMADPRMQDIGPDMMLFDTKRLIWGGFKPLLSKYAK